MTLVRLGKIRISVVAKRISPAWRTFDCLNMADCLLLLFLSVKCVPLKSVSRGDVALFLQLLQQNPAAASYRFNLRAPVLSGLDSFHIS